MRDEITNQRFLEEFAVNPEEQRIAIAEACGWTLKHCKYHGCDTWHSPLGICADGNDYPCLPDYLNDLNAMHAALKSQTQGFRAEFDRLLHAIAQVKAIFLTGLEAKDWADGFISCLQSQRDSGN